ncbi:MAG: protoheme IX farnesyltransferase [Dehalococcoidia bacterium]
MTIKIGGPLAAPRAIGGMAAGYLEVLKPRETALITFIGASAAVVAGGGVPPLDRWFLAAVAILLGSAGCNGLTNYLDRGIDARMQRTRHRVLPSGGIQPAEKVLPLTIGLVAIALVLVWFLHPLAFWGGVVGVAASLVGRGRSLSHLLGGISSAAPVWVGWLAISSQPSPALLWLCLLVFIWVPIHVWSLILSYRDDYLGAGLRILPVTWREANVVKVLVALSSLLYGVSLALFFWGGFGGLYLVAANILGLAMIYASLRLLKVGSFQGAWRLYKLSSYPYLGLTFLALILDLWL